MRAVLALLLLASTSFAGELQDTVVANSEKYLHIRERTNRNDAPEIDTFLAYLGLPKNLSWCSAFVVYNYREASDCLHVKNPLPRYGRVSMLWNYARANELKYRVIEPEEVVFGSTKLNPADIPIWAHGRIPESGNFDGHTGLVLRQVDEKNFVSREGNTQPGEKGNQREGGGVYDRKRKIGLGDFRVLGFIRVR